MARVVSIKNKILDATDELIETMIFPVTDMTPRCKETSKEDLAGLTFKFKEATTRYTVESGECTRDWNVGIRGSW